VSAHGSDDGDDDGEHDDAADKKMDEILQPDRIPGEGV
jgi:hypothetical protein